MSFDHLFPKRVSIARNSMGLTQSELAKKVGVVPRQIAAYEGGEARPRNKALQNLASALGSSVEWLTSGEGIGPSIINVRNTVTVFEIPIITFASIATYSPEDPSSRMNVVGYMPAPPEAGVYSFAVEVQGDSMDAWSGPSFPDGSIIIVDPETPVEDGDFAIFIDLQSNEATFKQYVIDQQKAFLRSLNNSYPVVELSDNFVAVGKVVSAQISMKLKSHSTHQEKSYAEMESSDWGLLEVKKMHERMDSIEEKLEQILSLLSNKKPT